MSARRIIRHTASVRQQSPDIQTQTPIPVTPLEPDDKARRYMALEGFLHQHSLPPLQVHDGACYKATPLQAITAVFDELERAYGNLKGKHLLDLGAGGDLRVSLAAVNIYNIRRATAAEMDAYISTKAEKTLSDAIRRGFAGEDNLHFKGRTDALEIPWSDVDIIFFYYTEPFDREKAGKFRERLQEKMGEAKPGAVLAVLFTERQLGNRLDEFPKLEASDLTPIQVHPDPNSLYLRIYRKPGG
jgi:hypothetical protein